MFDGWVAYGRYGKSKSGTPGFFCGWEGYIVDSRLKLSQRLRDLGADNLYFQPPTNTTIKYPCVIYTLVQMPTEYADNVPYSQTDRYTVTVIDRDPDSPLRKLVGGLPGASFTTFFTKDELNHFVFNVHTQSL